MGLEDEDAEKKRRWTQCVSFLRNNPRLLLQMIPNPDEDEDELKTAITVGRPRPAKKPLRSSKPPKPSNSSQAPVLSQQQTPQNDDGSLERRFLAVSRDIRNGPAKKSQSIFNFSKRAKNAQRPIKVRNNALRNKDYWSNKATHPTITHQNEGRGDDINYAEGLAPSSEIIEGMGSNLDDLNNTSAGNPDELRDPASLNINTIKNPSNMELPKPVISMSNPETTTN